MSTEENRIGSDEGGIKEETSDLSGGPVVKTSNAGGMCSIPGQRTKMSHTKAWPKKKKKRRGKASMPSVLVKEIGEFS